MNFSPVVINKFLGRSVHPHVELEVTNDQVCREITGGQVKHWPIEGKISTRKLTMKYAILHKIVVVNWVPTNQIYTITTNIRRFIHVE